VEKDSRYIRKEKSKLEKGRKRGTLQLSRKKEWVAKLHDEDG
jgi:hypothetical protein